MNEITVNGIEYVKKKGTKKEFVLSDTNDELPFEIGKKYFIRTVTYHLVGKVTGITGKFVHMKDASWVADSGRFMNAIKEGNLDEVEPVGNVTFNSMSIIDVFDWKHDLPKEQK